MCFFFLAECGCWTFKIAPATALSSPTSRAGYRRPVASHSTSLGGALWAFVTRAVVSVSCLRPLSRSGGLACDIGRCQAALRTPCPAGPQGPPRRAPQPSEALRALVSHPLHLSGLSPPPSNQLGPCTGRKGEVSRVQFFT